MVIEDYFSLFLSFGYVELIIHDISNYLDNDGI